jgi:hypothetical protein
VEVEVHQPLRHVERGDPVLALQVARAEHELVHAQAIERKLVCSSQPREHVVGVQDRDLGHLAQLGAPHPDEGI